MSKGRSSFTIQSKAKGASADIVSDVLKVRRFLLKGFHDPKSAIELQPEGSENRFTVRVLDADFRKDGLWIELAEKAEGLAANSHAMFMIYSPDIGVMGFKAAILAIEDEVWVNLGTPDRIVRTQKRLDPRFTIPKGYEVFVEFKKPSVEATSGVSFHQIPLEEWKSHRYRVFDVSSTGLGFVIPEEEAVQYPKGMRLKELRLRVRGREIKADADVMSCLPHKFGTREPMQKVGVKFSRISIEDEDTLRGYVVENLIQYDIVTDD